MSGNELIHDHLVTVVATTNQCGQSHGNITRMYMYISTDITLYHKARNIGED